MFYEQLASERKITRIVRGKPVSRFERLCGAKAECLDALVYAAAARTALTLNDATFEQRFHDLKSTPRGQDEPAKKPLKYAEDNWLAVRRGKATAMAGKEGRPHEATRDPRMQAKRRCSPNAASKCKKWIG